MDSPFDGIFGRQFDVEPMNELDYYDLCPECGQAIDVREIAEVLYHDEEGHQRLPTH